MTWPPFLRGQPERPARVLLADDDPHMCRVIAQELLADARIHLVAQANSLREALLPSLPEGLSNLAPTELRAALGERFARQAAEEAGGTQAQAETAAATSKPSFTLSATRRVRHWVDGLVIGSELFVLETMRRVRTEQEVTRHRLTQAAPPAPDAALICCWRRLRVMRD